MAETLTKEQRTELERRAWELRIRHSKTLAEIAVEVAPAIGVQVHPSTVLRAIRRVGEELAKGFRERAEAVVGEQLARLSHVQAEALAEWERSKTDAEVHSEVAGRALLHPLTGELVPLPPERSYRRSGRLGDPALLQRVMDAMKAQRELLGLDAPKRSASSVDVAVASVPKAWVSVSPDEL